MSNPTTASSVANMKVVVRLRPLSVKELSSGVKACCEVLDNTHIAIKRAGSREAYLKSQVADFVNEFAFDQVFDPSARQDEVYQQALQPYLPKLLDGQHVTTLAYGATGAGKTHTMFGGDIAKFSKGESAASFSSNAGVIPQCLRDLYTMVEERRRDALLGEAWSISLSFFEVYNDQVFDLIDPSGKNLPVREDADRGIVQVCGLKEFIVNSPEQIFEILIKGQKYRKMEPTMANIVSSRSHAILQVIVKHVTRNSHGFEVMVESKLSLIDLAGSERASATNNRGIRLQEGANINKSLLALANCINSLSENSSVTSNNDNGASQKKAVVKYRDSKLTHILKSSLEGNCNLIMITNINPSDTTYEDSLHTLQYANRAKNIKVNPIAREQVLESTSLEREARLREENDRLRKVLNDMEIQITALREENERLHQDLEASTTPRRTTFGLGRFSTGRKSNGSNSGQDNSRKSQDRLYSPKRESLDGQSSQDKSNSSPGDGSKRSSFGFASVLEVFSPKSTEHSISPKQTSTPDSEASAPSENQSRTQQVEDISTVVIDLEEDNYQENEDNGIQESLNSQACSPMSDERLPIQHKQPEVAQGRTSRGLLSFFICGNNNAAY